MNLIHPTAIVGPHVVLGSQNVIGPYVVLSGRTKIGDRNWFGAGVSIGEQGDIVGKPSISEIPSWDSAAVDYEFGVDIGSDNVIKEHVTIHAGSHRHTSIGNHCYLMPRSHLGHDCWVGDHVLLSPSAQIAGHVSIGSRTVIGMGALVHQFSNIGPVSMVGMGCCVRGDVDICRTVVGEPHRVTGINKVGIQRLVGDTHVKTVLQHLKQRLPTTDLPEPLPSMITEWESQITHRR